MDTIWTNYIVGNDTSYRVAYTPADTVSKFHDLPRFSHHADFSALFAEEPTEVTDYTKGLLFVACFIMSFFHGMGSIDITFQVLGTLPSWSVLGVPLSERWMGLPNRSGAFSFLWIDSHDL